MINSRILQLAKKPKSITSDDLPILENAIEKFPYTQSFRALYLIGIQSFNSVNYTEELSKTAAFTTDKKLLYRLIRKHRQTEERPSVPETISDNRDVESFRLVPAKEAAGTTPDFSFNEIPELIQEEKLKPVYVNGELNRILFEGEEDFMNQPAVEIDLESTKESGVIVLANSDTGEFAQPQNQEKILEQKLLKNEPAENGLNTEIQQFEGAKGDQEIMDEENLHSRKTLEETSANTRETKQARHSAQTSFKSEENFFPEINLKAGGNHIQMPPPQQLSRHDAEMRALIASVEAKMQAKKLEKQAGSSHKIETDAASEEPDANISQETNFSESSRTQYENEQTEEGVVNPIESNVPIFIDTWKNWLKLGIAAAKETSAEPAENLSKTGPIADAKTSAIDRFIETEPKISRLNEDSSFVARERGSDISHLMTETLANLYAEQKLYAKAIKAFTLLKDKYPAREDYFEAKINEIKELRGRV